MYEVWLVDGNVFTTSSDDLASLCFRCDSISELEQLLKIAQKEGYSVAIEFPDQY